VPPAILSAPYAARRAARAAALALAAALAVGGASAAACTRPARAGARGARAPQEATTLRVQNQNFLAMNIYVVRGGVRARLGTVSGNSTARFTIPVSYVQTLTPLRFLADPIGARSAPVSEEITVSPGDEVTLTIPPR
jgi:hypothetical protein